MAKKVTKYQSAGKIERMTNRANRLTDRANKITSKGSTPLNITVGGNSTTINTANNTKRSDRLLGRASVLRAKSIADPIEKARYIGNLPEGPFKDKVTKQGPIEKIKSNRAFKNSITTAPLLPPMKKKGGVIKKKK
tara:strand:+ start:715 stop:1122 length:408 start_codon:yes stop_codon:yes gene_type:complete